MSEPASNSRFTPQNQTINQKVSSSTVGLVALSDFRKRRAEVIEQHDRESRSATNPENPTPDQAQSGTPEHGSEEEDGNGSKPVKNKKKKKTGKSLLSFGDDGEGEEETLIFKSKPKAQGSKNGQGDEQVGNGEFKSKFKPNASVSIIPKSLTKSALRQEAAEREALRKEFLAIQEAAKATDIAIPFTFYDGSHIPGGTVRVKKGDFIWVFLDKSRKAGAELRVGERLNSAAPSGTRGPSAQVLKSWAKVGVDDLMLVRGTVIIPHHYDFYFFVMNKNRGPNGQRIFDYSAEAPSRSDIPESASQTSVLLTTPAARKAAAEKNLPDIKTVEGADDDPNLTKVVDRRWYERNKHIYPASTWQTFDPEKNYTTEIRRDGGGNTFFFRG